MTASRSGLLTCSRTRTLLLPLLPSLRAPIHENAGACVVVVVRARPRSLRRLHRPHRRCYIHGGYSGRAPRTPRLPAPAQVRGPYSGGRRGPPVCSRSSVGSVHEMTGSRGSTLRWCILSRSARCGIVSGEGISGSCRNNDIYSFARRVLLTRSFLYFAFHFLHCCYPRFSPCRCNVHPPFMRFMYV